MISKSKFKRNLIIRPTNIYDLDPKEWEETKKLLTENEIYMKKQASIVSTGLVLGIIATNVIPSTQLTSGILGAFFLGIIGYSAYTTVTNPRRKVIEERINVLYSDYSEQIKKSV